MDYFLLAVFLSVTGYVWWRLEAARRAEAWEEKLRDAHRLRITKDPKNVGAYEALGDSLRRAGRLDEAHEAYLGALDAGSDDSVLDRTRYKIAQLDRDIRAQAQSRGGNHAATSDAEIVFCRQCGEANPPLRPRCANCHAALPFHTFREALMNRDVQIASLSMWSKVLAEAVLLCQMKYPHWAAQRLMTTYLESACILAVLLIVLRVFYFLPLDIKGVVTISAIIVSGWRFLRAIEGK